MKLPDFQSRAARRAQATHWEPRRSLMALSPNWTPSLRAFVLFRSGCPLDRHERARRRTRIGPDRSAEALPRRAFSPPRAAPSGPRRRALGLRACPQRIRRLPDRGHGSLAARRSLSSTTVCPRALGRPETEGGTPGGKGSPAEIKRRSSSNWSTSGGALSRTPGECDRSRGVKSASIAMRVAVSRRPPYPEPCRGRRWRER